MSARHIVNVSDLADFELSQQVCGHFGEGHDKEVRVFIELVKEKIRYEVKNHGKIKLRTTSLQSALDFYNELP